MLPVYATHHNDVHHRHHFGVGSSGTGYASGSSFGKASRTSDRSWRHALIFVCVMLGSGLAWYSASSLFLGSGPSSGKQTSGKTRKLLDKEAALTLLPAAHLTNLVLVAGHAVYTGVDYHLANKEASWFLEPYQQVEGEAQSFLDHIRLGIEEAAADPTALLLFSGGQTRRAAGPRSEGLSYWVVAEAAEWFNHPEVRNRTFTEEHARDSFENVMFSLCRFHELTGHYPDTITVVSYTLKENRFRTLHRAAVGWPEDRFRFVGTEVPPAATGAKEGEARTVAAFQDNPYGCEGDLYAKKLGRDPFAVGPIHPSRCPEIKGLLTYCGSSLYGGKLPWLN